VALHVGARDLRRRWPTERFVAVARLLLGEGLDVVLVGGDADREPSAGVVAALADRADGECVDLSGRLSLPATLGTLARAELFVGNDSGPRHLAAAAGTPTVGVFWVGNVMSFGPLAGDRDRALVSFRMHCPVCGEEQVHGRCRHDVPFVEDVGVAEVGEAALDLLALGGPDRGTGTGAADAGAVGRDGSLRPRRPPGGAPGRAGSTDPATPG
jgi:ADP-heptose:LPS heptosyltransferase